VLPEVSGRAWLTGGTQYGVDPEDLFPRGYRLNDTWFSRTLLRRTSVEDRSDWQTCEAARALN